MVKTKRKPRHLSPAARVARRRKRLTRGHIKINAQEGLVAASREAVAGLRKSL